MIKVLGVNGSPRSYGASARLLAVALKGAEIEGAKTESIELYEYNLRPCVGCFSDSPDECREPCPVNDDWDTIYSRVVDSDALIVATPVYWYAPSAPVKIFVDRMTVLENKSVLGLKNPLEGKVAGVLAVGLEEGAAQAGYYLVQAFNAMGFIVPPYGVVHYSGIEDPIRIPSIVKDAINLGRSVAKLASIVKNTDSTWYVDLNMRTCKDIASAAISKITDVEEDLRGKREAERSKYRSSRGSKT